MEPQNFNPQSSSPSSTQNQTTPTEPVIIVPKPQVPVPQPPIPSQPIATIVPPAVPPQSPKKRSSLPLMLGLLLVILAILALWYFGTQPPEPIKITGLQAAQKTALFLDTTIQADGGMIGGFECDEDEQDKCAPFSLSAVQPHVGQAIFSYFLLEEATGDQTYRAKADRAINYVLDACDTDVRMCEWNFFPLAQYYEKTGEDKYLTRGMLRPAATFLAMPEGDVIKNNVGHKLASLYKATNDTKYRDKLVSVADFAIKEIESSPKDFPYMAQVAWSVFVPAYDITSDQKYLEVALNFFDNFNVIKRIDGFKNQEATVPAIKAADVLVSLSKIAPNGDKYRQQAHQITQEILKYLWDTPQDFKFDGDYGFVDDLSTPGEANKLTINNGWIMKILVLLKDDVFLEPPISQ
jgi:hypothetical protein